MATPRASLAVVVLAAGKGSRLRSSTIKLLHGVAGRPMVSHVVEAARALKGSTRILVVGFQADRVRETLGEEAGHYVLQREQRGTGHAVLQAASRIRASKADTVLILSGDLPTLRVATLRKFVAAHKRAGSVLSILSTEIDNPTGYGRIVRDAGRRVEAIVEHGDATAAQRQIREINSGIYCASPGPLLAALRKLQPDNVQGEYYITDAVRLLIDRGKPVGVVRHDRSPELLGVNTRAELAEASSTLYARKAAELQDRGVTLLDATRTWIDPRATVGRDTVIYPDVLVEGPSRIGRDCVIRQGSRLTDVIVGDAVEIRDHCVVAESRIGRGAQVGPFAHIRPGSDLQSDSRVGNFVELKKTRLGKGAKANHLAYLGDATIGDRSNIGAGTITCNYDGTNKHRTELGRDVFVGSDTQLIAPVKLGDGAYVAAGATVTDEVPAGALAISRVRQRNVVGWVARRKGGKSKRK